MDELPRWSGVRVGEVEYGPSSLQYFIHRLEIFTAMSISSQSIPTVPHVAPERLARPQQDYFLDLFWQGYHVIFPVIDGDSFRGQYGALWDKGMREASPIVDIVLALCIQSYMLSDGRPGESPADEYYQRAHTALGRLDEGPSLIAVQCYFYSIIYLLAKGEANAASILTGTALQMAVTIGLHEETLGEEGEKNTRLRVWSCFKVLDMQLAMHLGRPPSTMRIGNTRVEAYSDDSANRICPSYRNFPGLKLNWLGFHVHHRQLIELVHQAQVQFFSECNDLLRGEDFYKETATREKCAGILSQKMLKIKAWADDLPLGLKTPRRDGVSFSTDRSPLDLQSEPLWLQRQRIILELEYHNLCMHLYRPFICFSPTPALGTLACDNHCISALGHAISTTTMLHQLLSETDVLSGWYALCEWQRSAAVVAAGFACGYPVCPPTPSARKTLDVAAGVFEMLGTGEMVVLTRRLADKAGTIIEAFRKGLGLVHVTQTPSAVESGSTTEVDSGSTTATTENGNGLEFDLDFSDIGTDLWLGGDPGESQLWGDLIKDLDPGLLEWNSLG